MSTVQKPPDPTPEAGLFRKIAEVMSEVGYVEKRGRNDFHKYDYVTEADLVEAVRSKLSERHVALIPSVVSIDGREYESKGKPSVVTTVVMAFTFVDGETGAMFRTEWAGQGDDPADKGLYKAYTGALKYFLMKTFLIPTGDDPEADKRTDERGATRTAKQALVGEVFIGTAAHDELVKGFEMSGVKPAELKMKLAAIGASAAQAKQGVKAALACVNAQQAQQLSDWFHERADATARAATA